MSRPQKYENQQEFIFMQNWLVRLKDEEFDLEIQVKWGRVSTFDIKIFKLNNI